LLFSFFLTIFHHVVAFKVKVTSYCNCKRRTEDEEEEGRGHQYGSGGDIAVVSMEITAQQLQPQQQQ